MSAPLPGIRHIDADEVRSLLSEERARGSQRSVFAAFSRGEAILAPRVLLDFGASTAFSYLARASANGPAVVKVGSVTPGNTERSTWWRSAVAMPTSTSRRRTLRSTRVGTDASRRDLWSSSGPAGGPLGGRGRLRRGAGRALALAGDVRRCCAPARPAWCHRGRAGHDRPRRRPCGDEFGDSPRGARIGGVHPGESREP